MIKLFKTTPEFRVFLPLLRGDKSFKELKRETGLSSRWLSKTLSDLSNQGFIEKVGSLYKLASVEKIREIAENELTELNRSVRVFHPIVNLHAKAVSAANLVAREESVLAIVLFGSVVKGVATPESDIDLLVVSLGESDLIDRVYEAMAEVRATIEALTVSLRQFLFNLLDEPTMLFGILEGYEVLYDRLNVVKGLLKWKEMEIKKKWFYDPEEEIWLERRLLPYLRQRKTS